MAPPPPPQFHFAEFCGLYDHQQSFFCKTMRLLSSTGRPRREFGAPPGSRRWLLLLCSLLETTCACIWGICCASFGVQPLQAKSETTVKVIDGRLL